MFQLAIRYESDESHASTIREMIALRRGSSLDKYIAKNKKFLRIFFQRN